MKRRSNSRPIELCTQLASRAVVGLHPQPSDFDLLAQGSLTPPGAPGPTMKSLAQIESRTPISSAPYTITTSGSYYLTTNLTVATGDAITINADGVTLDLNGFTISSTASPATGTAILLTIPANTSYRRNIAIHNGPLKGGSSTGPGFGFGIAGVQFREPRVSSVSVWGCSAGGILFAWPPVTQVESTVAGGILQGGRWAWYWNSGRHNQGLDRAVLRRTGDLWPSCFRLSWIQHGRLQRRERQDGPELLGSQ